MLDPTQLRDACDRIRSLELTAPSVSKVDAYLLAVALADLERIERLIDQAELGDSPMVTLGLVKAKTELLRQLASLNRPKMT